MLMRDRDREGDEKRRARKLLEHYNLVSNAIHSPTFKKELGEREYTLIIDQRRLYDSKLIDNQNGEIVADIFRIEIEMDIQIERMQLKLYRRALSFAEYCYLDISQVEFSKVVPVR